MSFTARDKAITTFANNSNVNIMIASLRCGGCTLLFIHLFYYYPC